MRLFTLYISLMFFPLALYAQESGTPMSCKIKGQIVRILKITERDKKSVCSKYPCMAQVKILDVFNCGSSVTRQMGSGDIITVRFAYTLHKTEGLFPNMKTKYPGLKKGNIFIANTEERKAINVDAELMIYDYSLK